MSGASSPSDQPHPLAALLSALIPGLGQAVKRQPKLAAQIFLTGALLLAGAWEIGRVGGSGADIFFLMLIVLPWWTIQSYNAFLPVADSLTGLWR
ncbi:MAG: hypothetical protein C4293_14855, partial [Nitrospiraceae bacterium]